MKKFKNRMKLPLLAFMFLASLVLHNKSHAQIGSVPIKTFRGNDYKDCGGYRFDSSSMQLPLAFRNQNRNQMQTKTPYLIRVYFHICDLDNGGLPAATLSELKNEFDILKSDYAPYNICFLFAGVDYINNSVLDTGFNINTGNFGLYDPYRVPNCINIFYQQQIYGTNSSCPGRCGLGGYSFFIPATACLVRSTNIGSQTISHEIGHCLGLFHTFEYALPGFETISGNNSWIAGDMVQDTPADPFAWFSANNSCFSQTGNFFTYTGNCLDPNGASNYSPPYSNIMSYWNHSNQEFTQGQYSRFVYFLNSDINLLPCESPNSVTEGPGINVTSGYHEVSAISDLTTTGSVFIGGTSKSTLAGALVLLEPGFHADANSGANILITPPSCSFNQNKESEPIVHQSLKNTEAFDLKCYPNPFSRTTTINYDLAMNGNVDVKIYNIGMQMVAHPLDHSEQLKGNHQVVFNAGNLPSGIYLCKLETQGKVFTIKMILIR